MGARTTYFATVPEWLLGKVSMNAIGVYCVIDRKADRNGRAFPGRKLIADTLNVSEATVKRALAELVDVGALERLPRFREDGSRTSNLYRLLRDPPRSTDDPGGRSAGDPALNQSQIEPEPVLTNGSKNEPLVQPNAKIVKQQELEELWGACETYAQTPPTAKSPRSAYAKLVRELHNAGWTPQDVETRAEAYRKHPTFGKCELTLAALAKWGETFQTETQTRESRMQAVYRKAGMT